MAQLAADGSVHRKVERVHARARRANFAAIASRVGSLLWIGGDRWVVRRISVSWICHGGVDAGGSAHWGRGAVVLCSLWAGTPLSGARWACEHTGHWHSIRDSAN